MSYESQMLDQYGMPSRKEVEDALLITLFRHSGVIKEFGSGEEIVDELSIYFNLSEVQRKAHLETIYRKENRLKKSSLWHRLLFRAADSLATQKLICKPSVTFRLTNKKQWMLTESGYDRALQLLNLPSSEKQILSVKSFEVQKIVNILNEQTRPHDYAPFDNNRRKTVVTRDMLLRSRGFRQAVIEAYDCRCAFCGLKISSPQSLLWEVEAAHIVPHSVKGKDDIWNGIALCRLHHWAFDVGWFTLKNDFTIIISQKINSLSKDVGKMGEYNFLTPFYENSRLLLPKRKDAHPHPVSMTWHRENRFHQ